MPGRSEHLLRLHKAVGVAATAGILLRRALKMGGPARVRVDGHDLWLRPRDSDLFVLGQIFGTREYDLGRYKAGLRRLASQWTNKGVTPVILDIGANVGYSPIYFADLFPDAVVVAVEADRATFEQLVENVKGHDRIRPVYAAVWSHENGVELAPPVREGSWAGRVGAGAGRTPSMLLGSTFAGIPNARPLIVKLDVEGAEREICESAGPVLATVPCILIEPHDFMLPGHGCLQHLLPALAGRELDTLIRGENLMFVDSSLGAAS